MDPREVDVGLLGYGCVGAAVDGPLREQAREIERAIALRLGVRRALVPDTAQPRTSASAPTGGA
jgi:homoserine dehydrogenase